nr:pentapeptide repeat-containing protein [Ruegeria arenilitoris]
MRLLNREVLKVLKAHSSGVLREYFSEHSLSGLDLPFMDFSNLTIRSISFEDSFLVGAYFDDAELASVDFSKARLRYATFYDANLKNVDFSHSDWYNAIGIRFEQLSIAELKKFDPCPINLKAFQARHDEIYSLSFSGLPDPQRTELLDHWQEIMKPGAICDRLGAL